MPQLLFFLLLIPASAAYAQQEAGPQPTAPAIAVDSDAGSDAAIERRIRSILDNTAEPGGIGIEVNAGVVTLTGAVPDAAAIAEAEELAGRVEGVVTVRNRIGVSTSVEQRLDPAIERLAARIMNAVALLPLLGVALLLFGLLVLAGWWVGRLRRFWARIAPNVFIADLLRQVVRLVFVALGLFFALDLLGATALLGTLLGAAGILGLAIGFGIRDVIENYIASIMLSVRQPFRPNDRVVIEGHEGHVIRLTSRATIIMTLDGNHVRIPNSSVFKGIIVNYSRNSERRFDFKLGVDADSDLKAALEVGAGCLRDLDFVLDSPKPQALIHEVGDSNVVLWFGAWIDQSRSDFAKARSEAIRLTKLALETAGFSLPEPIYRLRMEAGHPAADRKSGAGEDRGRSPPASGARAGDASRQPDVPKKVDQERAQPGGEDLLDPAAPAE
ncbi:MAG TPA: mechanosensitive ion channel family protein [Gammaproteobacteria bacterium]|nr:mechanosensitive ion channel family protein [Gammaproteobacteria bacterium]